VIPAENKIKATIKAYHASFCGKVYSEENDEHDVLMDVFGLVPAVKRENRQYWGRELGMCWQMIVTELFRAACKDFKAGYREGADELCDLIANNDAIDTKYRVGSGDSGTLKKFKQYGTRLTQLGLRPVLLIVRNDNLPAAIGACNVGGWTVYTGEATFGYIQEKTGVDLKAWLSALGNEFHVIR
jgi:hypothetical protein